MQLQTNNDKKVWQAVRTGNSPTKLATLRQKDRQIAVHITTQQKRIRKLWWWWWWWRRRSLT